MPLEISEIGVHVAVGPSAAAPPAPAQPGVGGQALTPAEHEAIVNACVQQVLANLREREQR